MFSALGAGTKARILLVLEGGAQYVRGMNEAAMSTARNVESQRALELAMRRTNQRSFLQQQGMFTLRRYTFYATLATTALVGEVFRLGLQYNNTLQTARVGFSGMFNEQKLATDQQVKTNKALRELYLMAAESPFQFPDLTKAARQLQPFTKNWTETRNVVQAINNSLSGMGVISQRSLSAATLQLSHMYNIGRLTGQILLNLGRDNVPIMQALQAQYHQTGLVIRQEIAQGLISAQDAGRALVHFTRTNPAFAGAARRQAEQTLPGAFATLKDLIGMSAASSSGGVFESVRKNIAGINEQLIKIAESGRNLTMNNFMLAVDRQFTPHSHAIYNSFVIISTAIRTVVTQFMFLIKVISILLLPLDLLGRLTNRGALGAKLLGYAIGTLTTVLLVARIRLMLVHEAIILNALATSKWAKALFVLNGEAGLGASIKNWKKWAFEMKTISRTPAWMTKSGNRRWMEGFANEGKLARLSRAFFNLTGSMTRSGTASKNSAGVIAKSGNVIRNMATSIVPATTLMWGWVTSTLAESAALKVLTASIFGVPIIGWALLLITLLVELYLHWGRFHNAVNSLFKYIKDDGPIVKAALITAFGPIILAAQALKYLIQHWDKVSRFTKRATVSPPTGDLGPPLAGPAKPIQPGQHYKRSPQQIIGDAIIGGGGRGLGFYNRVWHNPVNRVFHFLTHDTTGSKKSAMGATNWIQDGRTGAMGATTVAPEANRTQLRSAMRTRVLPSDGNKIQITVVPGPVMMDGKKVGTMLATATTDKVARS